MADQQMRQSALQHLKHWAKTRPVKLIEVEGPERSTRFVGYVGVFKDEAGQTIRHAVTVPLCQP